MRHLSSDPAIPMDLEPFLAKVWFVLGIYFSFVWSRFKIRLWGILRSSTRDTISCEYNSWAPFFAPFGISILPVVFMRFLKPILRKKLFAQDDETMSMWSNIKCEFLAIRTLATDTAITKVMKPPLLRRANKTFGPFDLNSPTKADAFSVKHLGLAQWDVFLFWFCLALFCTWHKTLLWYFIDWSALWSKFFRSSSRAINGSILYLTIFFTAFVSHFLS